VHTGQKVLARTEGEVRQLGRKALRDVSKAALRDTGTLENGVQRAASVGRRVGGALKETGLQADTAVRLPSVAEWRACPETRGRRS
jgi:hypothetical protein